MPNQWQPLTRFLDDPATALNNKAAERAMRHMAIGRKSWTYAGSEGDGRRAAVILSMSLPTAALVWTPSCISVT